MDASKAPYAWRSNQPTALRLWPNRDRAKCGCGRGRKLDRLERMEILYGLHPVEEALKAGKRRFDHVCVAREREDLRLQRIVTLCREAGVSVRVEPREHLTHLAKTAAHQGVVAIVRAKTLADLEDLLEPASGRFLLALDGVEDPQNLGALLRTADGAGVTGVILTERRS